MTPFRKIKWFQKTATAILITFCGIMLMVIITAYSRRSGNTKLDMAKIQQLRTKSDK
jgi:hypothetical protein